MDVGKFKVSRVRLTLWLMVPPVLVLGIGLSSFALQLQSEWQLNRTRELADVLPRIVSVQRKIDRVTEAFHGDDHEMLRSEDELISFLQEAARKVGFTVDSLKVERKSGIQGINFPLLTAKVTGSGSLGSIHTFLRDVTAAQHLLSESSLTISQSNRLADEKLCSADISFELLLFDGAKKALTGSGQ